jgi:hypothetical protein
MNRQVEAHHYCTHYNQDMRQCLIYDSPEPNARLIGVEYIVSEKLYQGLPDEEKKLWHTHEFEVKGGILFIPGIPKVAEHAELSEVLPKFPTSTPPKLSTFRNSWLCKCLSNFLKLSLYILSFNIL